MFVKCNHRIQQRYNIKIINSDTILYSNRSSIVECQTKSWVDDEVVCSNYGQDKNVSDIFWYNSGL